MRSDATDNTMRTELLPCAFYGGLARRSVGGSGISVWFGTGCDGSQRCPAYLHGLIHFSQEAADAAWNRRADTRRGDITAAEAGMVMETHMRASDAGNTSGTSNWAIAILQALRTIPPLDNIGLSKPDRAPSEDGYPYG